MKCERFDMCLIVPFQYDKSWFERMGEEQDFMEVFEEKRIKPYRLDSKCQDVWNNQEIVRCFEIRQKYRKELNLHKNANHVYSFSKKSELLFSISKVNGWFMKTGEAFMTVRVSAKDLSEEKMMDLKSMLTRVRERHEIHYIMKTGRDTSDPVCFTIKGMIGKFLEQIEFVSPTEIKTTYMEALCLSYGIMDEADSYNILVLAENLRNNMKSSHKMEKKIEPEYCYTPELFPYLHWAVSGNGLLLLADLEYADAMAKENTEFLRSGLGASVFSNYLMFYLYYYSLQMRYTKLETQRRKAEKKMCMYPAKNRVQQVKTDLVELSDQKHINTLFLKYLCENVWKMSENLAELSEKLNFTVNVSEQLDAFISYRRIYGGYVARLLYNGLAEDGKNVFYDISSMRAGEFPEQIKKAIETSTFVIAVLTPGCLDKHPEGEKDWMYEELSYAMKCGKTIITLRVDGFLFPKELQNGLEKIGEMHGTYMIAENIDEAIASLLQIMEKEENIEKKRRKE